MPGFIISFKWDNIFRMVTEVTFSRSIWGGFSGPAHRCHVTLDVSVTLLHMFCSVHRAAFTHGDSVLLADSVMLKEPTASGCRQTSPFCTMLWNSKCSCDQHVENTAVITPSWCLTATHSISQAKHLWCTSSSRVAVFSIMSTHWIGNNNKVQNSQ